MYCVYGTIKANEDVYTYPLTVSLMVFKIWLLFKFWRNIKRCHFTQIANSVTQVVVREIHTDTIGVGETGIDAVTESTISFLEVVIATDAVADVLLECIAIRGATLNETKACVTHHTKKRLRTYADCVAPYLRATLSADVWIRPYCKNSELSDQTERVRRLIWGYNVSICPKTTFWVTRFIHFAQIDR